MNWMLILTAGFVAANIVWGFMRGLLRVVYSMVAWILILVIVTVATPHVADWMMKNGEITKRMESFCKEKIQHMLADEETDTEIQENQDALFWDVLPGTQKLADSFLEKSGAYDAMAQEMAAVTIKALSFFLVLVVTLIGFFLLAKILDLVGKLPVIGEVNHALGGVAGLVRGILLVWLIFALIAMANATAAGGALYTKIQSSPLLLWFYRNNPILLLLQKIFFKK